MTAVPNIKRNILGISIAIVLVFFVGYGITVFYEEPKYEDFCNESLNRMLIEKETVCIEMGGQWTATPVKLIESNETTVNGYCDTTYTCRKEFENEREKYNRNVFIITGILGLIAIIVGGIQLKLASVSSGIMGGGVLIVLYGTLRYWGNLGDIGRFIILGLVLVVLIWMGYKKFK